MSETPPIAVLTNAEKARAKCLLAEDRAQLVQLEIIVARTDASNPTSSKSRRTTYKLTRRWASIPDGDRPLLEAYLDSLNGSYIENPMCDREVRLGKWLANKITSSRYAELQGEYNQGVFQTLVLVPADDGGIGDDWPQCEHVDFFQHTDVQQHFFSATLPSLGHELRRQQGVIYDLQASLDTDTGLWNYEVKRKTAFRDIKYSWWDFDRYTLTKTTVILNSFLSFGSNGSATTTPLSINLPRNTSASSLPAATLPSSSIVLTIPNWYGHSSPAPAITGYLKHFSYTLNDMGLFDVKIIERWAINYMHKNQIEHPHYYDITLSFKNWPQDPIPLIPSLFPNSYLYIGQGSLSLNEFGLFDGSVSLEKAILDQTYTHWLNVSGTNQATVTHGYNCVNLPEKPSVIYGDSPKHEYSLSFQPNKFGLYDYDLVDKIEFNPYDGSSNPIAHGTGGKRWGSAIPISDKLAERPLHVSEIYCCASLAQAASYVAPHAGSASITQAGDWWIATLWSDQSEGTIPL